MAAEGPVSVMSLRRSVSFSPWFLPWKALGGSVLWSSEGLAKPAVGLASKGPSPPRPNRPTCHVQDVGMPHAQGGCGDGRG